MWVLCLVLGKTRAVEARVAGIIVSKEQPDAYYLSLGKKIVITSIRTYVNAATNCFGRNHRRSVMV